MTKSVLTIPSNFPIKKTIKVENGSQTNQMPIIAIESNHLDCIHGPYIVSPLDIAVANLNSTPPKKMNNTKRDQFAQTDSKHIDTSIGKYKTQCSQTDSKHVEMSLCEYKAQGSQTEFTSFTNPTSYMYPGSPVERFLVLDNAENLKSDEAKRKAEAFNQDFFMRHGNLFSIKFIIAYFHSCFKQSKL